MKHSGTVLGTGHRPHAHVLPSRRFAALEPCRSCRFKAVWAFMLPTSSKYNSFDVANQMNNTSYIFVSYIFHHFPTPHGFQTSRTSPPFLHVCAMWTPKVLGTSETRGALPWSGLDAKTQEEKYRPLPTSVFRFHDLKHGKTHQDCQHSILCELCDFEFFLKLMGLSFGMLLDVFRCPKGVLTSMPQEYFLSCAGRSARRRSQHPLMNSAQVTATLEDARFLKF